MSTISAGTTNSTALVETGDTTGNLIIQANTSTTVGTFSSTGLAVVGSLSATSGYNGTVGATTPSTGAFTTVSASSTVSAAGSTTIDSSGNLGVGATAPSTWGALAVRKAVTVSGRSVSGSFSDASTGTMEIAHASGYVALDTETSGTALRIAQAGTINGQFNQYGLGIGSGVPSSGMGITFPATQSASTDANTLDDYEEGTWSPSVGGTATYTTQAGRYTKIGNIVYIQGHINILLLLTGSASTLSGLPFSAASGSSEGGFNVTYFSNLAVNVIQPVLGVNGSTSNCTVYSRTTAGTGSSSVNVFGDNARLFFYGHYQI